MTKLKKSEAWCNVVWCIVCSECAQFLLVVLGRCVLLLNFKSDFLSLTSSAAMVRQGQCFLVSFTLTALEFWTVFRALDRFSGVTSKQISLCSEETPSIWYSSKTLACKENRNTEDELLALFLQRGREDKKQRTDTVGRIIQDPSHILYPSLRILPSAEEYPLYIHGAWTIHIYPDHLIDPTGIVLCCYSPVTAHTTCWRLHWPLYQTEQRTGCLESVAGHTSWSALK